MLKNVKAIVRSKYLLYICTQKVRDKPPDYKERNYESFF